MALKVDIDVAKHLHWVVALTDEGQVLVNRKLENSPTAIGELVAELDGLDQGPVTVGIDVIGGIAGLLTAMLGTAGDPLCARARAGGEPSQAGHQRR